MRAEVLDAEVALTDWEEILAAAGRIARHTVSTPLLRTADGLWIKPENQQPTGSFKVRGAVNAVARSLSRHGRTAFVAQSSGNHGQAMAYAGERFGAPVTVVVPHTAPAPKVAAIRRQGAAVVVVDPADREAATVDLAERTGAVLVRSDAPDVVAGTATVGLEIAADLPETDVVLAPVGNGGLLAGIATALHLLLPDAAVLGVEPELAADAAESLRTGVRTAWPTELVYRTVADGLRLPALGPTAWPHVRAYVREILTVAEADIVRAVDRLLDAGIAAEPSGAVAAAAFHTRPLPVGTAVAVCSGGNVSAAAYGKFLGTFPV